MKRSKSAIMLTLSSVLLVSGCSTTDTEPDSTDVTTSATAQNCDTSAITIKLLGRPFSAELLEQARKQSGAEVVRILSPGGIMTLEYNMQRLTLHVDENQIITRVSCG